jgi:hypothetical protein
MYLRVLNSKEIRQDHLGLRVVLLDQLANLLGKGLQVRLRSLIRTAGTRRTKEASHRQNEAPARIAISISSAVAEASGSAVNSVD